MTSLTGIPSNLCLHSSDFEFAFFFGVAQIFSSPLSFNVKEEGQEEYPLSAVGWQASPGSNLRAWAGETLMNGRSVTTIAGPFRPNGEGDGPN